MWQVTVSAPALLVQQAAHPVVRSLISKYAVSAADVVFPVPKQLPSIMFVWLPLASNGPTAVILGVHVGVADEGVGLARRGSTSG
jgi:hypothetical protein